MFHVEQAVHSPGFIVDNYPHATSAAPLGLRISHPNRLDGHQERLGANTGQAHPSTSQRGEQVENSAGERPGRTPMGPLPLRCAVQHPIRSKGYQNEPQSVVAPPTQIESLGAISSQIRSSSSRLE